MNLGELTGLLAVFFGGLIILTPMLAISTRFALKPLLETMARLRQTQNSDEVRALHARRIELLENEVEHLRRTLRTLVDGQEFDRLLQAQGHDFESVAQGALSTRAPRTDS
jgi:hypothetical protein